MLSTFVGGPAVEEIRPPEARSWLLYVFPIVFA